MTLQIGIEFLLGRRLIKKLEYEDHISVGTFVGHVGDALMYSSYIKF